MSIRDELDLLAGMHARACADYAQAQKQRRERVDRVMRDCGITEKGRPITVAALALCDQLLAMSGDPAELGATAARVVTGVMNEAAKGGPRG